MASRRAKPRQIERADQRIRDAAAEIYRVIRAVTLDEITVLDEVQVRVNGLDEARVEQYVEYLLAGGAFKDPIDLFQDGQRLILSAGWHRTEAYRRALERFEPSEDVPALAPLKAEIHTGGLEAAIEWAEEDNLAHGLELSPRDKRNILERRFKRGHEWAKLSNRALAAKLGVSRQTVANWREEIEAGESGGKNLPPVRVGADGKTYSIPGIQAANQRRAEERQAQDEPGKTAQANAKLAAKIDELREAVLAVVKGRAPMTYREIEFAVNAYLGRIANPGLLSGAINVLTRNGSLRSVGGGRYALPGAEPVQQNGSDWLDTPVERGATPSMAIAANGAPAHSDDHDEALDAAYRSLAVFGQAVRHADESIRKLFEIRGIRALYALPPERMKQVYGDVTALRYLAEELSTYCDEQIKKLRLMARTGRPYDEEGGEA